MSGMTNGQIVFLIGALIGAAAIVVWAVARLRARGARGGRRW